MRKINKPLFIGLAFLLSYAFCSAQKFSFYKYNVENGLPQSTVFDIFQDHNGYLWLGTDGGGVTQYNGHFFKTYTKKDGLAGNVVRKVVEDKNNTLWLATNNGLYYFENDKFKELKLLNEKVSIYVMSLKAHKNKLYVGTTVQGFFEVDLDTKKPKQYSPQNSNLSNKFILDFLVDEDENVWITTVNGGINCLKPNKEISSYNDGLLSDVACVSLFNLGNNNILCGTRFSGFFVFNTKDIDKKGFLQNPPFYLSGNSIWSANIYKNQLYIASQENGVFLLDKKTFEPLIHFNKENGLPSNQIYKVYPDNQDNLWLATSGSGLVKFAGFSFLSFDKSQIATSSGISCITKISDNKYWAGSSDGVFELTSKDGFSFENSKIEKFNDIAISCIYKDANQNIFLGTKEKGLYVVGALGEVKQITENEGLAQNTVSCITHSSIDNSLWVGTGGGISVYKNGEHFFNLSESNGLANNEVYKIEQFKDDIIAATNGGLVIIHGSTIKSFDEEEGLLEKRLITFSIDKNGWIYLGTFGDGIYVSDAPIGEIKKFKKLSNAGLSSENVYSLTFCNDTLLAAATDRGLSLLSIKKHIVNNSYLYNNLNGFEGIESNINANYLSKFGQLFLGTVGGLSVLTIPKLSFNFFSPKIIIDSIKINNKSASSIPTTLKYNLNSIELAVGLIGYSNVAQHRLEYKLEGSDANWTIIKSNAFSENGTITIKYNKLPWGKYRLLLKGLCTEGVSPETSIIEFEILPPFWSTWWFILLAVALLVLIIFAFIRIRENVLREQNRLLEATITERTKEIVIQKEEIEQQSVLLSHKNQEITDSINYAQRIQNSLLPDIVEIEKELQSAFIVFKPKDIVSGDFYWVQGTCKNFCIVAADCTGHGVPGAFMSVIGIEKLNDAYEKNNSPAAILTYLNNAVKKTLKQNSQSNAKDGMDLAFIKIENNSITYSGANRPLYVIRKGSSEVDEIKADKVAIGGFTDFDYTFSEHQLNLLPGDTVYIFSDGYADQFGGNRGEKLMTKKFKEMLLESQGLSMAEQKKYFANEFESWKAGYEQVDDVLLIGYRF